MRPPNNKGNGTSTYWQWRCCRTCSHTKNHPPTRVVGWIWSHVVATAGRQFAWQVTAGKIPTNELSREKRHISPPGIPRIQAEQCVGRYCFCANISFLLLVLVLFTRTHRHIILNISSPAIPVHSVWCIYICYTLYFIPPCDKLRLNLKSVGTKWKPMPGFLWQLS